MLHGNAHVRRDAISDLWLIEENRNCLEQKFGYQSVRIEVSNLFQTLEQGVHSNLGKALIGDKGPLKDKISGLFDHEAYMDEHKLWLFPVRGGVSTILQELVGKYQEVTKSPLILADKLCEGLKEYAIFPFNPCVYEFVNPSFRSDRLSEYWESFVSDELAKKWMMYSQRRIRR